LVLTRDERLLLEFFGLFVALAVSDIVAIVYLGTNNMVTEIIGFGALLSLAAAGIMSRRMFKSSKSAPPPPDA